MDEKINYVFVDPDKIIDEQLGYIVVEFKIFSSISNNKGILIHAEVPTLEALLLKDYLKVQLPQAPYYIWHKV